MNREEIIEMLASIGVNEYATRPSSWKWNVDVFQKFADLIAAKEREAYNRENNAAWKLMCEKMVIAEREAIAKFCESNQVTREAKGGRTFMPFEADGGIHEGMDYAKAIRARGQQ